MDAEYHAQSCAKKWGGQAQEYLPIHLWFDETSVHIDDSRHRMLRHPSLGISQCIEKFGRMLRLSTGKSVPVKKIAERHINEDLGFVPTVGDWVRQVKLAPWMDKAQIKRRIL